MSGAGSLLLHALLGLACLILLAGQFRRGSAVPWRLGLVTAALAGVMATGLAMLGSAGGLANARFFGHVMHWLGWLAVLTWLHVLMRARTGGIPPKGGVPLFLTGAAGLAGLLALLQDRV
ncbi:MAG TPA: hypothetical protein VNS22_02675 [Geminicoccus sp.]|uniref:hypothetical protein n=1 Tax=Geminicoccus sp. TaxID=2024832 RepID=UPI002CD8E5B8|nr:hypothetical protein [Geminicoccus sp.]HWL67270.1 hypothetical protein [Geminicoccus sp.]